MHLQCHGHLHWNSPIDAPSQCFHTGRRGWRCGCSSSWMDEGHWPWPRSWGRGQCTRLRTAAEDTTPCLERRRRPACTCCCRAEAAGGREDLEGNGNKINEQRSVSLTARTQNLNVIFYWIDFYLSCDGRQCFVLRCFIWLTVLNELDGNTISIKVSLILFVHFSVLRRRRRMWRKWRLGSPVQSLTGLTVLWLCISWGGCLDLCDESLLVQSWQAPVTLNKHLHSVNGRRACRTIPTQWTVKKTTLYNLEL